MLRNLLIGLMKKMGYGNHQEFEMTNMRETGNLEK